MIIETTASKIIGFLLLFGPYVWELMDDRKGDLNKRNDLAVRGILMALVAAINAALNAQGARIIWLFLSSFHVSLAIFFMFFDYSIAAILVKNKVIEIRDATRAAWFRYLGRSSDFDNWSPWRNLTPRIRLIIRVAFLAVALLIYFVWV